MLDKRFWATTAAVIIVSGASFILTNNPGYEEPIPEAAAGAVQDIPVGEQAVSDITDEGYAYLVGEHDGKLAVFVPGQAEPHIVYNVMIRFLPDYDRIQLAQGIPVVDYAALSAIIEDFIS